MSGRYSYDSLHLLAKMPTPVVLLRRQLVLSVTKYTLLVLLLVNFRSLPLAWHIRLFLPVLRLSLQYYLLRLRIIFKPKKVKAKILNDWNEALCPIGASPFELVVVQHGWATLDDIDFNGHLSNSSYAKAQDGAGLNLILKAFPAFTRSGGLVAVGSTHFHFIQEIPFLARYEIRLSIRAWDHKWLFITARFVSFPKNRRGRMDRCTMSELGQHLGSSKTPTTSNNFSRMLRTPAEDLVTPPTLSDESEEDSNLRPGKAAEAIKDLAAAQSQTTKPDNAVLHCVAVSYVCFKHGRITVPPSVILACEGFSKPPSSASSALFSPTNPPTHWKKAQALRVAPSGSMPKFIEFLKGGWREVPEGERWWEDALDGPIEEQRTANLKVLDNIRKGMEEARSLR
ncbi:uncharacterized protein EDB91DRAFT_391757 [Suillus paluster]|uniref:uncharacterized protein n=1 Tax=Suillus paluster TaxID=48578 RepID=UPI001B86579A|nr:uncharacterized protein EDB91DRAFT_391757 [Suillus paluster]KAG1739116.1 hypothetical protein EDB91DRAFT_391757 [Suillus paluster]